MAFRKKQDGTFLPNIPLGGYSRETQLLNRRSRVFLKLDNLQPSGSFKSRGIGNYMQCRVLDQPPGVSGIHFYAVSGGNAGIACVHAARVLGYPATVVVPTTAKPAIVSKLLNLGATEVLQQGSTILEADEYLRKEILSKGDPRMIYVPPFDHPDVWDGNATVMKEISSQLPDEGKPDVVICSVGGGGLLNGVMRFLDGRGWSDVDVVAMETEGADSLRASLVAGKLVTLKRITSQAKSLGVARVSATTLEYAQRPQVRSVVLPDSEAARGSLLFAQKERMMVELTVGVSVAVCCDGRLSQVLGRQVAPSEKVVIIVCGGNDISVETLALWTEQYGR